MIFLVTGTGAAATVAFRRGLSGPAAMLAGCLTLVAGAAMTLAAIEIGVDKNTTVVFPAPLMSTIAELGSFLASEQAAATRALPPASDTNRPPTPPSGTADAAP